jgi:hypothetical protein
MRRFFLLLPTVVTPIALGSRGLLGHTEVFQEGSEVASGSSSWDGGDATYGFESSWLDTAETGSSDVDSFWEDALQEDGAVASDVASILALLRSTVSDTASPTLQPTRLFVPAFTPEKSEKSCEELGLTSNKCGGFSLDYMECSGRVTFQTASALCADLGARLCTADELDDGRLEELDACGEVGDKARVWAINPGFCPPTFALAQRLGLLEFGRSCVRDSSQFYARCCADPADVVPDSLPEPIMTSAFTCSQLHVEGEATNVCATSKLSRTCFLVVQTDQRVSWAAAQGVCEEAGARLCSAEELARSITKNTGCLDEKRSWSSTRCDGGMVSRGGIGGGGEDTLPECSPTTRRYAVRCCADKREVVMPPPIFNASGPPALSEPSKSIMFSVVPSMASVAPVTPEPTRSPSRSPTISWIHSRLSCDDLGWISGSQGINAEQNGTEENVTDVGGKYPVCAWTAVADNGTCPGARSFVEASDTCLNVGARLCSPSELSDDVAFDTGCGLDMERVWTAESCIDSVDLHLSQGGSSLAFRSIAAQCRVDKTALPFRCCADAVAALSGTARQPRTLSPTNAILAPSVAVSEGVVKVSVADAEATVTRSRPFSSKTCSELMWSTKLSDENSSMYVCASTKVGGDCTQVTFVEAAMTCRIVGARLCEVVDLDVDSGSSCQLDSKRIWLGRGQCGDGEALTAAGSKGKLAMFPARCEGSAVVRQFRCCADDSRPYVFAKDGPPDESLSP